MNPILTAPRLKRLATWEHLGDSWYLIATATLTVCNRPQEIPRLYHYAMHVQHLRERPDDALYHKVAALVQRFEDIKATGAGLDFNPYGPAGAGVLESTDKLRESILKTAALSGLPKCINAMMVLKDHTPAPVRAALGRPNRPPVCSWDDYAGVQRRGREYWDKVYTKISTRVEGQMASSYPDLWTYTIENVYSPLLSFNEVLTPAETSLIIVASLVPQDVNPQLKGHLKGAVNSGVPVEQVQAARDLALLLGGWAGVTWRGPVANVARRQ